MDNCSSRELADFLQVPHVVLFPTGWGAGYGAIKALVHPYDHIVIDAPAHDCLQHGARATGATVSPFAHNDVASLDKRLRRIRSQTITGAILVVTESLFSMDSDHPDFTALVAVCRAHEAQILVDVAHDLGATGPGGRGVLAEAGVVDDIDVVIGSFSKSFGCLGGFVATRSRAASYYVRGFSGTDTFSNYLMPAQVAAVTTALRIIGSEEREGLRRQTMRKSQVLRAALTAEGFEVMGRPSPIVLPRIGSEGTARLAQRECLRRGVIVNSIEFPACRKGEARFRLQVSPRHEDEMLPMVAAVVRRSVGMPCYSSADCDADASTPWNRNVPLDFAAAPAHGDILQPADLRVVGAAVENEVLQRHRNDDRRGGGNGEEHPIERNLRKDAHVACGVSRNASRRDRHLDRRRDWASF